MMWCWVKLCGVAWYSCLLCGLEMCARCEFMVGYVGMQFVGWGVDGRVINDGIR